MTLIDDKPVHCNLLQRMVIVQNKPFLIDIHYKLYFMFLVFRFRVKLMIEITCSSPPCESTSTGLTSTRRKSISTTRASTLGKSTSTELASTRNKIVYSTRASTPGKSTSTARAFTGFSSTQGKTKFIKTFINSHGCKASPFTVEAKGTCFNVKDYNFEQEIRESSSKEKQWNNLEDKRKVKNYCKKKIEQ